MNSSIHALPGNTFGGSSIVSIDNEDEVKKLQPRVEGKWQNSSKV
jgi:hypothetical protein